MLFRSNNLDITLFPNPSSGYFNLEVNSDGWQPIKVRILDALGRELNALDMNPNETIQFGFGLKAGVYFIETRQGPDLKVKRAIKLY